MQPHRLDPRRGVRCMVRTLPLVFSQIEQMLLAAQHQIFPFAVAQCRLRIAFDPQPQANDLTGLNDIIVTARRTEESLARVPAAATVIGSDVLEKQRILRASDLQFPPWNPGIWSFTAKAKG